MDHISCSILFVAFVVVLSRATPVAVMQALQNLVVPVGTPFSSYLSEMRLLVGNVRCVGHVAPEDGAMQTVI